MSTADIGRRTAPPVTLPLGRRGNDLGLTVASEEKTAWPRSWYPLALSRQVRCGQVRATTLFGRSLIVFRTAAGKLCVATRHCCHMGADLSRGRVRNETLHCPLHGWGFDVRGHCVSIPSRAAIPDTARLLTLTCHEAYGIVYAFVGAQPFAFPCFPTIDIRSSRARCFRVPVSSQAISLNAFDSQHFEYIHARRLCAQPTMGQRQLEHLSVRFRAAVVGKRLQSRLMRLLGARLVDIEIDCWGGNHLYMRNHRVGFGAVVSMQPLGRDRCLVFLAATGTRKSGIAGLAQAGILALSAAMTRAFLTPDIRAISGMQPRPGHLLEGLDDGAQSFFRYWAALPRIGSGEYCP